MLLIGSRAAKHHLPDFRDPQDWDFIVSHEEMAMMAADPRLRIAGGHPAHRAFAYGRTYVKAELADGSSAALLGEADGEIDTPFGRAGVASLDALLLLKRSHVCFRRMWRKHFRDYKVLQEAAGCVPERLEPVLEAREAETKARLRHRDRDFDVANDKFFQQSERAVTRLVEHDSIHEAVKLGDVPVFTLLKDDPSRAAVSFQRFLDLPFPMKMRNMQEECMVLTVERRGVPAAMRGEPFREREAMDGILQEMCYNYLPYAFRAFCVDFFYEILATIPRGLVSSVSDSIATRARRASSSS